MLASLTAILSSCTNINTGGKRSPSSTVSLSNPAAGLGGSFQLIGVYSSQNAVGAEFDMIGADSMFDQFCTGTSGPCVCVYTYQSPGVGETVVQQAVRVQESDLLRCPNGVPSGINSFEVKILANGSGDYSNAITVNLSNSAFVNTAYVDLSSESAYQPVTRFQCRHREQIMNPLGGGGNLIDPIQSEDPRLIYPFNFYTTNVAQSLWGMQTNPAQDWDCTLTPNHDSTLHWWANPYVFSSMTCSSGTGYDPFCNGDGELMYPLTQLFSDKVSMSVPLPNAKMRSSFFLAKQRYGVFDVAVTAPIAPGAFQLGQVATPAAGTFGTIGFAARTIPGAGGTSSCPNIALPPNAQWVKLWNYAATNLESASFVTGSNTLSNAVVCNPASNNVFQSCFDPGKNMNTGNPPFTDWRGVGLHDSSITYSAPGSTPENSSIHPASNSNVLASRVVVMTGGGNTNACYNITAMGNGQEAWHPSPFAFVGLDYSDLSGLPWDLYGAKTGYSAKLMKPTDCTGNAQWPQSTYNYLNSHSSGNSSCWPHVWYQDQPVDTQLQLQKISQSNYNDYLLAVTSPSVNDTSMRNSAYGGSGVPQYQPVTYRSKNDCNCSSQNGCAAGCSPSKRINWHVDVKAPGAASTTPDLFPLCVLQFSQ